MNAPLEWFLALPLELQLGVWFLVGVVVGGQINRGIYRLAFDRRAIGPWSLPAPQTPPRHWSDRVPVVGWLGLQREAAVHGRGFWIRPLLIELFCGVGLAILFFWEMDGKMVPPGAGERPPLSLFAEFLSHATLLSWLVVATFIDFDERTIPDEITVPGTIMGLLFAAKLPASLLAVRPAAVLLLAEPNPWPLDLHGKRGLLLGILCFLAWCFALLPKTWTRRRGLRKAFQYLFASMIRTRQSKWIFMMAVVGVATITLVWSIQGLRWAALLTSLVGMAFGGGLVWSVRIVGGWGAGREAMGFGDVTLMAMIGAFVGWQSTLMVFFLAPFAGMAITIFHKLTSSDSELAFGPFLSLGTLVLLMLWADLWLRWGKLFEMGSVVLIALAIVLAFLGLTLRCMRWVRER